MDMRKYKYWKDRRLFGRIRTLERMIDKRKDRIKQSEEDIQKFKKELVQVNGKLKKITELYEPNVTIKKVKVGKYEYWRGDVRFWGKDKGYQIGRDEVYKSRDKDYWVKEIQKRFRKDITDKEIEDYLDS